MSRAAVLPARRVGMTVVVLAMLFAGVPALAQPCRPFDRDADALEQARWAVATACDCRNSPDRRTWNACVVTVLRELHDMGRISSACLARAHRFELDSTCGRPGTAVCCRYVDGVNDRIVPSIRPAGTCASESVREVKLAHRAEACFAFPTLSPGDDAELCGNSRIDSGETCDPPNGTTCSQWCHACPAREGQISLGCSDGGTEVAAAASAGSFLVAYTDVGRQSSAAVVKRIDGDGNVTGGPIAVETADTVLRAPAGYSSAESVTSDERGFYVAWIGRGGKVGRRVPQSGAITDEPRVLTGVVGNGGIGMCRDVWVGPVQIAFDLAGDAVHHTQARGNLCGTPTSIEGLPFGFRSSPPIVGGASLGRLARGTSDVAAAWSVVKLDDYGSTPTFTLYGGWIEPDPAAFPITDAATNPAPGLAAVGDTFLVAYPTPGEVRAVRFSRSGGPLDPLPGLALGTGLGEVIEVTVTSDGERFVVAWKEDRPSGPMVRVVRVSSDGTVLDVEPRDVVAVQRYASFSIAATSRTILVGYTDQDGEATAARAVVVADPG